MCLIGLSIIAAPDWVRRTIGRRTADDRGEVHPVWSMARVGAPHRNMEMFVGFSDPRCTI